MQNTKTIHISRRFLNTDDSNSDASIFTRVRFYGDGTHHEIDLKIRDCIGSIDLYLGLGDEETSRNYKNSLQKVHVLIEELQLLEDALIRAKEEYLKRLKKEYPEPEKLENYETDNGNNNTSTMQCDDFTDSIAVV